VIGCCVGRARFRRLASEEIDGPGWFNLQAGAASFCKAALVGGLFHFIRHALRRTFRPRQAQNAAAFCFMDKLKNIGGRLKPFQPVLCGPIFLRPRQFAKETEYRRIVIFAVA
jgi:hypothetical protein